MASVAGAAPATAALGGANRSDYAHVPDLRSVSVGRSGPDRVVFFVFDEPLAGNAVNASDFRLGGYASSQQLPVADAASVVGTRPNVVELRYASSDPDLSQVTYAVVDAGAVRAFDGNQPNRVDSTAVDGADGRSGTRGHTTGPDLVGVRVDESNLNANVLIFTFDQRIDRGSVVPGQFRFLRVDGQTEAAGALASASDYEVAVRFGSPPGDALVTKAVRANVGVGAVQAADHGNPNLPSQAVVAGQGGATALPDLLSAEVDPSAGATSIDYHYDKPVNSPIAASFLAYTATGVPVPGSSAVVTADGYTVRVNHPHPSRAQEHYVQAATLPGAVRDGNGTAAAGGATATGGNVGAFADGWTSAPDATAVTFDRGNGQVDVTLDTRLTIPSVDPAGFSLIDGNGDLVQAGALAVLSQGSDGAPGPQTVRLQFLPQQVAVSRALEIAGYDAGGLTGVPFRGSLSALDPANAVPVAQALSPAATAAAVAPVGTPRSRLTRRPVRTVGVLPASVRRALRPTRDPRRARANSRVIVRFLRAAQRSRSTRVTRVAAPTGAAKRR
ncbi:hypothetical protein PAI11_21640 [Patulibacter medicamentivorans]|uniref:Uncharacterized protein n=2 Tax=Patulibacter medicamentivorans TaxID=1097667 RepID=H0E5R5_9ACTN|nr:hypothetical protein PAI11_21640 [Patulibacter medicamentivorans]